ncbi:MAG: glycosyltransferase family 39 protein, partial [Flavobacteriales bacterium]|nr:glycosyltransferase family 39 protein [Flavobacteriales bacterium]
GLAIRLAFLLWGAELYYGRADFHVDGDTGAYIGCITNLIDHGTYNVPTRDLDRFFIRPPGYPMFLGVFYLLSGKNIDLTYNLVMWTQIILDVISIWLVFQISVKIFKNPKIAHLTAFLYATYPFIIVWTPIIYAEATGIFFLLLAVYHFTRGSSKRNLVFTGVFLSIACLTRPQIGIIFPIFALVIAWMYKSDIRQLASKLLVFGIPILLVYGAWPARNYLLHDKLVFVQDLGGIGHWAPDYMSFMEYVYSVKTDHEPQYTQIVSGDKVVFPKVSYHTTEDSLKLAKVIQLCRTCGEGFNHWMLTAGIRSEMVLDSACTKEIETLFTELKNSQMTENWFHYYFTIPFQNLGKAIFKFKLYDSSGIRRIASLLFMYRTLLIFLGCAGLFWLYRHPQPEWHIHLLIALFAFAWYFFLCSIYRNIEIRYLLPVDVLLLFPASYMAFQIKDRLVKARDN